MKYAILVLALLFASCSAMVISEKNLKLPNVESLYEAEMYVFDNIDYKSDSEVECKPDSWKLPCETLRDGYGDCEDMSLLFLEICRVNGLGDGYFVISYCPNEKAWHAFAIVGEYIFGYIKDQVELYSMPYSQALAIAGYL